MERRRWEGGGKQETGQEQGVAREHQLCLPADPNTLGFFATEGLKVHPTRRARGPTATHTNRNRTKENNKKEAKQLRVSWARKSTSLSWRSSGEGWVGARGWTTQSRLQQRHAWAPTPRLPGRAGPPLVSEAPRKQPGQQPLQAFQVFWENLLFLECQGWSLGPGRGE